MNDFEILNEVKEKNYYKALIYGTPGIGKSTFATKAIKPIFLPLEDGLKYISCAKLKKKIETYKEFIEALRFFSKSDYKTIVIDTMDSLEQLIFQYVCEEGGKKSISEFGYGKGYARAMEIWRDVLNVFDIINNKCEKNIIGIAHEQIKKFEDPSSDGYDRYGIKIHHTSANYILANFDAVFFARYETIIKRDSTDETRTRAISSGKRVVYTCENPAWIAKNRFNMPECLDMDENIFKNYLEKGQ